MKQSTPHLFHDERVARGDGNAFERAVVAAVIFFALVVPFFLDSHILALMLMVPLAMVLVDFLSGVVHWLFDHHISCDNPLLGRFVYDFHDHHVRPQRTLDVGFFKSAFRSSTFVTMPLLLVTIRMERSPYLTALIYGIALFTIFAAQIHKLAHSSTNGSLIIWLQDSGLLLSPRRHAQHHVEPQNRSFCITTGWCNPLLDATNFWRHMDRLVWKIKGRL